jgi:hypothetical protein
MTCQERSAGGCETTTADINNDVEIITRHFWLEATFEHYRTMLVTSFRGLA